MITNKQNLVISIGWNNFELTAHAEQCNIIRACTVLRRQPWCFGLIRAEKTNRVSHIAGRFFCVFVIWIDLSCVCAQVIVTHQESKPRPTVMHPPRFVTS